MDNSRFLLAIILMIAVIIITNQLAPPAAPPPAPPAADTVAVPEPAAAEPAVVTPAPPVREEPEPVVAAPAPAGVAADTVFVESPLYRYGFSTRGGGLAAAELLRWESFTAPGPVDLVPRDAGPLIEYRLRIGDRVVDIRELQVRIEPATGLRLEPGGGADSLRVTYGDPATGSGLELTYTFSPDEYLVHVSGRVTGAPQAVPQLLVDMGPMLRINEADPGEDERALAYVFNSVRQGVQSVNLSSVREQRIDEGPLVWIGLKNKYFLAAAISAEQDPSRFFGGLIATDAPGEHAADITAPLPVGGAGEFDLQLYLGPQEYSRLAAVGRNLEDANPYGWRILRPIIRPLAHLITWALVGLHDVLGVGYGWVLILFGIIVRVLLWPLNARAMRSQLKNMELQPRLKEIQDKYKSEPEKLQKEMIRLYREEGFNPLGGCLPMLIPFPVLITLFFVFQATIEFRGVSFLWLPDLSRPDPFYALPLILGASMFLLQKVGMRTAPANPQMKMMLYFMPIFMVVIFLNLASGLNLYYAASNLATVPQQLQLVKERARLQARTASA